MNKPKGNKKRKCKNCGYMVVASDGFIIAGISFVCSFDCATGLANKALDKARKKKKIEEKKQNEAKRKKEIKEARAKKESIKDRTWYLKESQKWFNKFIRLRDSDLPCVSCGRFHKGQYHAGHYRTTKSCPKLRFNEFNCHKQCSACNNYLSGNISKYRASLVEKIGLERLEWLEGDHQLIKYEVGELKSLILKYKAKCKELES